MGVRLSRRSDRRAPLRLARAANRFNHHPDSRAFSGGFRVARTIAN
jgi:formylglycine-generating enzyme required for sulfatase activity